jgi:hypothetical protein
LRIGAIEIDTLDTANWVRFVRPMSATLKPTNLESCSPEQTCRPIILGIKLIERAIDGRMKPTHFAA